MSKDGKMTRFVSVMTCQLNIDLQMEHTMLENQGSCFTFELGVGREEGFFIAVRLSGFIAKSFV